MSSKPNLGVDQLGEVRFSKTRKQAKQAGNICKLFFLITCNLTFLLSFHKQNTFFFIK